MAVAPPGPKCLLDSQLRNYLNVSRVTDLQEQVERHIEECGKCESRLKLLIEEQPGILPTTYPGLHDDHVADQVPALQRYQCLGLIDQGGFGLVWKMKDLHFNRLVAVKVMKARDVGHEELKRRFFAEAQICSQLSHPNIVPVHDMGELPDGRGFYAMRLVEGKRLDDHLEHDNASVQERLQLFERICQAVAFAHDNGVVHRDLKPANIMLGRHGDVQVMDWGLAKVQGADESRQQHPAVRETSRQDSDRTARGALGTLAYMAPEQAVDGRQATTRSDVYSLGIILFEMLTGERFHNFRHSDAITQKPADEPKLVGSDENNRERPQNLDPRLGRLIEACTESTPSARPKDAVAVLTQITEFRRAVEQETEQQKIESERQKVVLDESRKKRRLWVALATVLMLALAGTGVAAYVTNTARKDAEVATQKAVDSAKENQRLADNRTEVIDFLTTNVFGKADPWKEADRDISFRKVLDLATKDAREMKLDPEVKVKILTELGKVYFNLGEYPISLALFSQSEEICTTHLKVTHLLHMTSLDQKGMVLLRMEKFTDAEQTLKKALRLQTEVLGKDHEDTIHSMAKLGDLYSDWGKPEQAISITKEVLAQRTRLFGPKYRFTLVSMNGLALLYDQMGRDVEAVKLLRKAREIATEVEGPENVFTLTYANNLAQALVDLDELDEAEQIEKEVLAVRRRILGKEHSAVFASRHSLARIWFGQERFTESLTECDSMLKDFADPGVRRSVVIFLKAKCHAKLGQTSEASKLATESNNLLTEQLGEGHRFNDELKAFVAKNAPPVNSTSQD